MIGAAMRGHVECVRLLVQSGANKEVKDEVRDVPLLSIEGNAR